MALDTCPECGANISELDHEELQAHRDDHWPREIDKAREFVEARRRARILDEEISTRSRDRKLLEARRLLMEGQE